MDDEYERAMQYATFHLNPVFVKDQRRHRIGATTKRWDWDDVFWSIVVLIPTCLILWFVLKAAVLIPAVRQYLHPFFAFAIGPFVAILAGREISKRTNPYRKEKAGSALGSGESLASYFKVRQDKAVEQLIWKSHGQRTCHVMTDSYATGKRKHVACKVWMGTAPSQHSPQSPRDWGRRETSEGVVWTSPNVVLSSDLIETDWHRQSRLRRQRQRELNAALFDDQHEETANDRKKRRGIAS